MYSRKPNCGTSLPSSVFMCLARRYIIDERSPNFLESWSRNRPYGIWGEGDVLISLQKYWFRDWESSCANWFVGIHSCKMFNRVDWVDFRHTHIYFQLWKAQTPTGNKQSPMDFFFSVTINEFIIRIFFIWLIGPWRTLVFNKWERDHTG
jgi:hypothetical protein